MSGRRRSGLAANFALLAFVVLLAAAPHPSAAQGVEPPRVRSILIGNATNFPSTEPSLLPLPDEQLLERARTLLRGGQSSAADRTITDLETRHPEDLDVLLVRAEFMQRQEPAPAVARFLDTKAKQSSVAKALRERPFRAGFWSRFAADSYAAAGKVPVARARALEAWERSPEQASWARVRLEQWSDGNREALAKDVAKLATKDPARTDLALEASRLEALAGRPRPAVERIVRAEARGANRAVAGGGEADAMPAGSLLWQLALSLRSRDDVSVRGADSALVALALGPYDPELRERAVARLFEDRARGDRGPGAEWMETSTHFLGLDATSLRTAPNPSTAKTSPPPDLESAERERLRGLEGVWRGLPGGPESVRRGLDLADRLERVGEAEAALRVARDAGAMAARTPGATDDPEVAARLTLAAGEEALRRGDLGAATRAYDAVRDGDGPDALREDANFQACEARFFAGAFDSAGGGYDAFARAYPGSAHANDALERAYLIESGGPGAPGLAAFADASRLARIGRTDEALARAREAETASVGGPAWSHAGLLVASLLETKGRLAEAAAKARAVAETVPDDRLAPTARRRAGDLLLAGGDQPGALTQYEELLDHYPRSWLAPETRRRVQALRAKQGGTP